EEDRRLRHRRDVDAHRGNGFDARLMATELPHEVGTPCELPHDISWGDQLAFHRLDQHETMGDLGEDDRRGRALQLSGFTSREQPGTLARRADEVVDEDVRIDEDRRSFLEARERHRSRMPGSSCKMRSTWRRESLRVPAVRAATPPRVLADLRL